MSDSSELQFKNIIEDIKAAGLYKSERVIEGPQGSRVSVAGASGILNFCANNYLGLSQDKRIQDAAISGLKKWGYGLSSVRFICGTQSIHKELENRLSRFLGMEDTILYSSCFDANGGLFETLLSEEDAIISDELNHASIIDGIRLCKAKRFRYKNSDMNDLEAKLIEAKGSRQIMIATDGVFSMDGYIANLKEIAGLAKRYNAILMVDDSHAVGFVGPTGRGTHEFHNVMKDVDIITGTLGKALGGASGGYVSASSEIVDLLRQRSRPYLFSNTLAPVITAGSIEALNILEDSTTLRDKLEANTKFFRGEILKTGLSVLPGTHPIVPVMLGDASLAVAFSKKLLEKGVYAIGFSYPVVPKDKARIRTQISAAHSKDDLIFAVEAFGKVKEELGI